MDETLHDIRILKLAEMYENAYEAFVLEMAERYVQDEGVKTLLRRLAGPADQHGDRITAQLRRLDARIGEVDRASVERAAIQDVLEIERAARAFYLKFVEEVRDPQVAELFRDLAREEAGHIRIAEDALALHDRRQGRPRLSPETERMLRLLDESPAWEGVSDFGPSRRTQA